MIFDLLVEDLGSRPQRGSYRSDHVQMAEPDSDMRQGSAVQCRKEQYDAVQYRAVQCSAGKSNRVQ